MKPAFLPPALSLLVFSSAAAAQCDNESQKLLAESPAAFERYGQAVAVTDGALFVGAPSAELHGRVYVYGPAAGGWAYRATLEGDSVGSGFGAALSVDGDTLAVGAPNSINYLGVAYVFERDGAMWRRTQRLNGNPAAVTEGYFGQALSVDGDTVAVGAYGDDFNGSVRTFVRQGTTWLREAVIWNPSGPVFFGTFGARLELDRDTLLVSDGAFPGDIHAIYHLVRSGGVWTAATGIQVQGLPSMALDGDWLALGDDQGVRIFNRNGTGWAQQAVLDSPDRTPNDRFGRGVAIDGGRVVVGAPGSVAARGAAYVFDRNGSTWTQTARFAASDGQSSDELGRAVTVFAGTVVAGAAMDRDAGQQTGSSYVFDASAPGAAFCTPGPTSLGQPAVLTATGCGSVEDGSIRFSVSPVPHTHAVFAYGPTRTARPFGNSVLCVGSPLTPFMGALDGPGSLSWSLDLGQAAHDQVSAGSTWFFQAWFRDPAAGSEGANLSNALEVTFLP